MREKIDIHAHYFPPAYDQMLEKRGMKLLDGGFPKPEWNEEIQLSFMEKLGITYSVLSISSPHLHMGDVGEAIEVARSSNEYGAELMNIRNRSVCWQVCRCQKLMRQLKK